MPRSSTRTVRTTGVRSTRPRTTHGPASPSPPTCASRTGVRPQDGLDTAWTDSSVRRRQASNGAGQAGVRPQPFHPSVRLGTVGAQARLQGRAGCVCEPRLHFASLQPVRAHSQVKPSRAEPAGSRRTPTTTRRSTSWCGRDWGCCTARSAPSLVGRKANHRDSRDP